MTQAETFPVRERRLRTARLELAARQWGNPEGIPILALHGWLDNAASFDPMLRHFDLARYQVVALDLPGHGWSQHRPAGEGYHLLEYLVDIIQVLDLLEWRQCILLGHSLGGGLAMLMASVYPERVQGLLLIDALGPLAAQESETPAQLRRALDRYRQGSAPMKPYGRLEDAVAARSRGDHALSEASAELIVGRNLREEDGSWLWRTDPRLRWPSLIRMTEGQVRACLAAIECPVLLIAAEQGLLAKWPQARERLDSIKHLTLEWLPGGHHLHMEPEPDRVAGLCMAFLTRQAGANGQADAIRDLHSGT